MSYTEEERGKYYSKDRLKQIISFEGIKRLNRNITPTDIDALIDYNGNAFIFNETKYKDAPFHEGQRMAIENVINGLCRNGSDACCFYSIHEIPINEIVILKNCIVLEIYHNGCWHKYDGSNTVLQWIEVYEKFWSDKGIKL